jgi:parvulin-like peptidyl-prolyl isomerase
MTHRQLSRFKKQQRRQRLIFFGGVGIVVAIVLIIIGGWFAGEYLPWHQTILQVYDTKFDASFFVDTLVFVGKSQGAASLSNMASSVANQIMQDELIRQEAGKLGISVTDEEATQYLTSINIPVDVASIELARGALLTDKVKNTHFGSQVPTSDTLLQVRAMMVESESVAELIRGKMLNSENFTELAKQYALDAASKANLGDYGEHPLSIFKDAFFSTIPMDYISRVDAKTGDLSQPLSDNASKKLGYWLIRINDRPITTSNNLSPEEIANEGGTIEVSANVSALFLSSLDEAMAIRARLLAGEALGPIAEQYSQYNASKNNKGELGLITSSQNVSDPVNAYVFDQSKKIGEWSQPIRDDTFYYTNGGFWVVQIVSKEANKALASADRDKLISDLYSTWLSDANNTATPHMFNYLNQDNLAWVIAKATEKINKG